MEIKHTNSFLQRKIDQKVLSRTSKMQMHCLILNGNLSGTFNTITLNTPLRGKKYVSNLIRFLQKRLGKCYFVLIY